MKPSDANELSFFELAQQVGKTRLIAWIKGQAQLEQDPWLLYLSPTNLCNLRCAVCARHKTMRKERGFLTLETLDVVLAKLPDGIRKVYLQKQGEPLMNPRIVEIAHRVRARWPKAQLAMHTNGIFMTPALAEALVPLLDFVAFSISGISEATYLACHGRPHLGRALSGLEAFLAKRHAAGAYHGNVVIDYVRQAGNREETPEQLRAFFETRFPGLNSLDIHWTDNFHDTIDESRLTMRDVLPSRQFPRCVWPFSSLTVLHDGTVDYCFVEPRENRPGPSLLEQSFAEIWRGPYLSGLREGMCAGHFDKLAEAGMGCRDCAWLWSTQAQRPDILGREALPETLGEESIVAQDAEDLGKLGLIALAKGALPAALGHFEWASRLAPDPTLLSALAEWRALTLNGLDLCWPKAAWVAGLAARNIAPADFRTRYERFGYGLTLAAQGVQRRGPIPRITNEE